MKSSTSTGLVFVLIAAAGGGFYWWLGSNKPQPLPLSAVAVPSPANSHAALPEPSPTIRYPVSDEPPQAERASENTAGKPLPALDESDSSIEEALSALIGKERLDALFNLKDIARKIVVAVNNATERKQLSLEYLPFNGLDSAFRVTGRGGTASIAPSNFQRYAPYVGLARAVDPRKLVAAYAHFYPLFQAAYQDLGKAGYFNDRLVQVVDHLLATPDIRAPIKVSRPSKFNRYKFADSRLENLSSGQKILVRMGSENAHIIEEKLREIRTRLVRLGMKRKAD